MKTQDAIKHFNNRKIDLARALGIQPSAVTMWRNEVPLLRQYQLECITKGALKADPVQSIENTQESA